jgi:hypothetical protein
MPAKPRKRRAAGDLGACKRVLWSGIQEAVKIVEHPETPADRRLKAISCLSTAIGVYGHLIQNFDHEARIAALEQAAAQEGNR